MSEIIDSFNDGNWNKLTFYKKLLKLFASNCLYSKLLPAVDQNLSIELITNVSLNAANFNSTAAFSSRQWPGDWLRTNHHRILPFSFILFFSAVNELRRLLSQARWFCTFYALQIARTKCKQFELLIPKTISYTINLANIFQHSLTLQFKLIEFNFVAFWLPISSARYH